MPESREREPAIAENMRSIQRLCSERGGVLKSWLGVQLAVHNEAPALICKGGRAHHLGCRWTYGNC